MFKYFACSTGVIVVLSIVISLNNILAILLGIEIALSDVFSLFESTSREFTRDILSSVVIFIFWYVEDGRIIDKILLGRLLKFIIKFFFPSSVARSF